MSRYPSLDSFNWSEPALWNRDFNFALVLAKPGFDVVTDFAERLQPSSRPARTFFYVGQTINLQQRLRQHLYGAQQRGGSNSPFRRSSGNHKVRVFTYGGLSTNALQSNTI